MNPKNPMNPFALWAGIFNATEGRFFTVEFTKKDGSLRRLNGRIFQKLDPTISKKQIVVKDVHVNKTTRYRSVNPNTICAFKCGGFQIGKFSNE